MSLWSLERGVLDPEELPSICGVSAGLLCHLAQWEQCLKFPTHWGLHRRLEILFIAEENEYIHLYTNTVIKYHL